MDTFGDKLKKLREKKGLSQISLSKLSGVSRVNISAYETNRRNPKVKTIGKLAFYVL